MRKQSNKAPWAAKEVNPEIYENIIKRFDKLSKKSDAPDPEVSHLETLMIGIMVTHCQPDITFKRIGKILDYLGVDNLDKLAFMDELKKLKIAIESYRATK